MEEMRIQKQDMEETQYLIHGEVGVRKNSQVLALEDHPQLEIGVLAQITNMETNKSPICFQGVVAQADVYSRDQEPVVVRWRSTQMVTLQLQMVFL